MRSRWSVGMPWPVSEIVMQILFFSRSEPERSTRRVSTVRSPPYGMAWIALIITLRKACWSRCGSTLAVGKMGGQGSSHPDLVLPDPGFQEGDTFLQELRQIRRHNLGRLESGIVEEALDDLHAAGGLLLDDPHGLMERVVRGHLIEQILGEPNDDPQGVVDLVGDSTRDLAETGEFAGPDQLRLQGVTFGKQFPVAFLSLTNLPLLDPLGGHIPQDQKQEGTPLMAKRSKRHARHKRTAGLPSQIHIQFGGLCDLGERGEDVPIPLVPGHTGPAGSLRPVLPVRNLSTLRIRRWPG